MEADDLMTGMQVVHLQRRINKNKRLNVDGFLINTLC